MLARHDGLELSVACTMPLFVVTMPPPCAGLADRRAGTAVSYAQPPSSLGMKVVGVLQAPGIWSHAVANVVLPEVGAHSEPELACNSSSVDARTL